MLKPKTLRAILTVAMTLASSLALTLSHTAGADAVSASSLEGVAPVRLLETRSGVGLVTVDGEFEGVGRVGGGSVIELVVAGRGGVALDAVGVFLNVAAVLPDGAGFVSVFPCGGEVPVASSVNFAAAGGVTANLVFSRVGVEGKVCVFSSTGTDLIADVTGFVPRTCSQPEAMAPPIVTAVDSNRVSLAWAPTDAGGCAIESYEVRSSDGSTVVFPGFSTSGTFSGLINGASYAFQIRGVSEAGPSPWSPLSATVTPCGLPDAPQAPTVTPLDSAVSVTWTPPPNNGCPILEYTVQEANQGLSISVSGGANQFVVAGLVNGTDYRFRVRAISTVGASTWSPFAPTVTPSIDP